MWHLFLKIKSKFWVSAVKDGEKSKSNQFERPHTHVCMCVRIQALSAVRTTMSMVLRLCTEQLQGE